MGDWWIIGDNAGLGCPSRVEFLAVWDNGDWYASDVERLRLTAGFCSSREARSAACSTAARRCINNLLLATATGGPPAANVARIMGCLIREGGFNPA